VQGPIGRIGKPQDRRKYRRFETGGILLYVEEQLLESLPVQDGQLTIYMGDYGAWVLRISS
jgi:hypothetical protein